MMMVGVTGFGVFFGLFGMTTPLIAFGAILYLVIAKPQNPDLREAH